MDGKKRQGAADMLVGAVLIVFSVIVVAVSISMEIPKMSKGVLDLPGFFPALVGICLTVFGIALLFTGYKTGGVNQLREIFTKDYQKSFWKDDRTVRVLVLMGLIFLYVLALQFAREIWSVLPFDLGGPFIWLTMLYLFLTLTYLKATPKKWQSLLIAVIASVTIALAFRYGFQIRLPGQ
ncbi:MAG: tripartite tricarboxylate transporter TctB family protein [Lachnospiraceae bacterium]|nr:tripartite tricarboxylate transporter TctB family protein [Lachnospiraceae bacterium]